ncbi:MAG: hypothetical protein WAW37_19210 [Syntrophobacteraceae bacterium]
MTNFQGLGSATLIGSMPHRDRDRVIDLVMRAAPDIPVWPQLPAYPGEQMMVQYIEGLPGLVFEGDRMFARTDNARFDEETYSFYEEYLALEEGAAALETSRFRLGEETGATFRRFLEILAGAGKGYRAVKGQVVGPFTLLSGLKDQDGRALLFDDRFVDIVPKLLAWKARWQIERLKAFGVPVIVFLDEPALAGFGSSAFITVTSEQVRALLTEVVAAIHAAGALAGIHVCANTDWLLAFQSDFDIINFDAYTYFDRFVIYRKECLEFLARGGNLAWGVVPTLDLDAVKAETPESLIERWTAHLRELASEEMPAEKILAQSIFTPSCGCATLPESAAGKVLDLLDAFCRIARKK